MCYFFTTPWVGQKRRPLTLTDAGRPKDFSHWRHWQPKTYDIRASDRSDVEFVADQQRELQWTSDVWISYCCPPSMHSQVEVIVA